MLASKKGGWLAAIQGQTGGVEGECWGVTRESASQPVEGRHVMWWASEAGEWPIQGGQVMWRVGDPRE